MERSALVSVLRLAQCGLSAKGLLPARSCFFFDGKMVRAYDDVIGVELPCPTDTPLGGLRGELLLGFLSKSSAQDITIAPEGDGADLVVTAGKRSKLRVAAMPSEELRFEFPEEGKALASLPCDDALLDALSKLSISLGHDLSNPWRIGVTISFRFAEDGKLVMYSTDNLSCGRVEYQDDRIKNTRAGLAAVVFPPRFCELLVAFGATEYPPQSLYFTAEWVVAKLANGGRLFSRCISDAKPGLYDKIFLPVDGDSTGVLSGEYEIPEGFSEALDRAVVVVDADRGAANEGSLTVRFSGGKMVLDTLSAMGASREVLLVPGHPDMEETRVNPKFLLRPLAHCSHMTFVPGRLVCFSGGYFSHVVSVIK